MDDVHAWQAEEPDAHDKLTRRRLLQGTVALGAGGVLLAGCGSSSSSKSGSPTPASAGFVTSSGGGTPVRGGTLKLGIIGGGTAETLIPGQAVIWPDISRSYQLFDRLFENAVVDDRLTIVPGLALSADHNADATKWTIHLRTGVVWHDGKPFTADDVLWSLSQWATAANYASSFVVGRVDVKGARKLDSHTVEIPLLNSLLEFPSLLSQYNFAVIQNGTTTKEIASHPVGTGPFKFVSFTAGQQSVFNANANYWQEGKPYLDSIVIDTSYSDETSRQNALLSGIIDAMIFVNPTFARSQAASGGGGVSVMVGGVPGPGGSSGAVGVVFTMRVDVAPFKDVRVRQAFKLMLDRQTLIDAVPDGFGAVGNDSWGFGTQYFDTSLVPSHDPEKAKSLLKAAGQSDLSTTIHTSNATDGFVGAATLLAQQAALIGVKVGVQTVSPTSYFTPSGGFLSGAFRQDEGATYPSMTTAYTAFVAKSAPYNDTHWTDDGTIARALTATPSTADELWAAAQRQQVTDGGTILWVNEPYIDAAAKHVHGLRASAAGPMDSYRFLNAWLAKT